jgi:TPP-dependent indolepyruvate ferredoxin oxidoreductase alpha subunit
VISQRLQIRNYGKKRKNKTDWYSNKKKKEPTFPCSNEYSSPVIIHTNTDLAHAEYKPAVKKKKKDPLNQKRKDDFITQLICR